MYKAENTTTMAGSYNKCPHMDNVILLLSPAELCKLKQGLPCSACTTCGPNLWICLHRSCLYTGCSEQANDHSTEHFKADNQHCVHMNLSSQRIWCYLCETEVFLTQRRSSLVNLNNNNDSSDASRYSERIYERNLNNIGSNLTVGARGESPDTSVDEDDCNDRWQMDGLVGLQNIANTCYMNAALQALSNTPPLTYYFLDCGDIIEATSESAGNQRKPGLAKSYHRLIKDMWCRNKRSNGYVVPRGILCGIRSVHPMFRGYQQHDTQEFLRCFMDQLHEELKEFIPPPPPSELSLRNKTINLDYYVLHSPSSSDCQDQSPCSTPSQSEAEYETCDSGVSEQSSLSEEGPSCSKFRNQYFPRSLSHTIPKTSSIKSSSSDYISSSNVNIQNQQQQKEKTLPKPPHRSIISDVFDGKLLSSVQCLTCDRVSTREETFQDLSLPIPGKDHLAVLHQSQSMSSTQPQLQISPPPIGINCTDAVYQAAQDGWLWWVWNWFRSWFLGPAVSLHDCMAAFFSADELKGDNMYSCEKCNKLRNGIKYSRVLALPEMLCVHLKRFRHDLSYSSKISSPVIFPLTGLDMRPYLHKDCTSEISTYDLTAVICHHGTVGGGHYTSFAKHELTGKWFEFDDQLVTEVNPDIVQNCQAYVLFYRKVNPQMANIRAQAQELAEMNLPQASDIRFFVSRQWINRFNTFAEPGPIDNWAILCPHGGLPPCKVALIPRLAVPLPQTLWDFLYKKFGGGPVCNRLFECDVCKRAAETLTRKQENELDAFTKYNSEFQYEDSPSTIYAISMAWLRQWQLFARGVISEEPGPINNKTIAGKANDNEPIRNVLPGSDYAQLNTTLWKFFHSLYGGGPEIILRGGFPEESQKEKDLDDMEFEIDQPMSKILPSNSTLISTSSIKTESNEKSDVDNNERFTISSSTSPTPNSVGSKISKNVSFDDDPEEIITENHYDSVRQKKIVFNSNDDDIDNDEISSSTNNAKINQGASTIPSILSIRHKMKDKKFRSSMKSSGLFGPEGKYHSQKTDHIPDTKTTSISGTNIATTSPITTPSLDQKNKPNPTSHIDNLQMKQIAIITKANGQSTDNALLMSQAKKRTSTTPQQQQSINATIFPLNSNETIPLLHQKTATTTMTTMTSLTSEQSMMMHSEKDNNTQHLDSTMMMIEEPQILNVNTIFSNSNSTPNNSNSNYTSKQSQRKKLKSKSNRKSLKTSSSYSPDHCSDSC